MMTLPLAASVSRTTMRCLHVGILVLALVSTGCRAEPASPPTAHDANKTATGPSATRQNLQAAIDRSAHYLADACDAQGRFVYRINLDPSVKVVPRYNVLRHAGAIYALAQYCQRSPDAKTKSALLRSAQFLRHQCMAPAAENPNFLAVWSDPELVGGDHPRQAKLGGTGLGLVALLSVEQVEPGFTPIDELRKLGRFLVYMQKSDGTFYSKYFPDTGRNDTWKSMYYPGEAALGLLMLYEQDPSPQWLHTATKTLVNLARGGAQQSTTFPDQWYLLALGHGLDTSHDSSMTSVQDELLEHARHICRDMVQEQRKQLDDPMIEGCFTPEGRTCPSATRLEGLIAAMQYLPQEDEHLLGNIRDTVQRGLPFLLASQVRDGPHAGALPRFKPGFVPDGISDGEKPRMQEVRIDYVQHALSAMLAYQREFFSSAASESK